MNKKFLGVAAALMLTAAVAFSGCSSSSEDSQASADPLADGVLTIGTEATYVPMEYRDDNNELVGFDIDLGNALAEELGVTVEWKDTSFDAIFTGLDAKQYDAAIAGISITPERQENMTLSSPYIANGIVIVSRNDGPQAKTAEDLAGKTAGVQLATTADTAAESFKASGVDYTINKYDSILEAFAALEGKSIDYVITDKPVGDYYTSKKADVYNVSSDTLSNEPVGIATRKDDTEFSQKIEDALQKLRDDGTLKALSEKWFGEDVTQNISMDLKVIE